jgi:hypothetical protein
MPWEIAAGLHPDIDKLPSAPHAAPASSSRSLAAQPGVGAVVLRTGNADAEAVKKPIHGDVVQRAMEVLRL